MATGRRKEEMDESKFGTVIKKYPGSNGNCRGIPSEAEGHKADRFGLFALANK